MTVGGMGFIPERLLMMMMMMMSSPHPPHSSSSNPPSPPDSSPNPTPPPSSYLSSLFGQVLFFISTVFRRYYRTLGITVFLLLTYFDASLLFVNPHWPVVMCPGGRWWVLGDADAEQDAEWAGKPVCRVRARQRLILPLGSRMDPKLYFLEVLDFTVCGGLHLTPCLTHTARTSRSKVEAGAQTHIGHLCLPQSLTKPHSLPCIRPLLCERQPVDSRLPPTGRSSALVGLAQPLLPLARQMETLSS